VPPCSPFIDQNQFSCWAAVSLSIWPCGLIRAAATDHPAPPAVPLTLTRNDTLASGVIQRTAGS
jgi:hypothetical protein